MLVPDESPIKNLFSLDFIKELEKESQLKQLQDDDHRSYDQEHLQEGLLNYDHQQEMEMAGAQKANH